MPVRHHNFDGDTYTKTNIVMMNREDDTHTYVEAFSPVGFRLTSGFRILGPCVLFPKSALHWSVASSQKITPASLSLFCLLEPKLDILILGIGDRGSQYDKSLIKYLRSKRINVEILPTEQACSTFNFLNSERRVVAAALIPPTELAMDEDSLVITDDLMTLEKEEGDITKMMNSFKEKGVYETVTAVEKSQKHSSPAIGHSESEEKKDSDKRR